MIGADPVESASQWQLRQSDGMVRHVRGPHSALRAQQVSIRAPLGNAVKDFNSMLHMGLHDRQ